MGVVSSIVIEGMLRSKVSKSLVVMLLGVVMWNVLRILIPFVSFLLLSGTLYNQGLVHLYCVYIHVCRSLLRVVNDYIWNSF